VFRRGSPAVSAPSSIGWWSDCDRAFDIVNLRLDVPTLKGALEKTPSFMSFEVTTDTALAGRPARKERR